MKKLFAISIVTLAAVLTLGAYACKKAPEQGTLTAEEILQLPKSYEMGEQWFFPKDFSEVWNYHNGYNPVAVVKGTAISVKYYLGFDDNYDDCSLVEFQIDEVVDEYNTAALKPGDVITVIPGTYIIFKPNNGNTSDAHIEFFSEKTGLDLHDPEAFKAARAAYLANSSEDTASHKFELIPKKGVEYEMVLATEYMYPLQSGESYTMFVPLADPRFAFGQECYFSQYIFPLNEELSYEKLNEKYGFRIETFGSINEEIAEMFK
ncbi:MAG: hypothetical protein IKS90_02725 [Clostridia bacterium]|nr:hypothetical protein [Clostridia bacterium]